MNGHWEEKRIDQVARVTRGASPRPIIEWIAPTGIPWIKISDATKSDSRFIQQTKEYIRAEGASRSVLVKRGDFIVSNSATPGVPRFIDLDEACIHDGWLLFRDFKDVLPEYLYYRLLFDRGTLVQQGNGSVFTNLKTDIVKSHLIPIPPIAQQRAISESLGALDDKIDSNRTLISLISELISATVEREIAFDSQPIAISSLARFVNGGAYTKNATGHGRMVLRIAELNKGPGSSTVYNELDVPEDRLARPGDILMSWSGSLGVYRWALDEAIVNQHIFKVIPNNYPAWLVFNRLEAVMPIFKGHAADKATTMGHIQRGHLETTQTKIPTSEGVAILEKKLGPLWQRLLLAENEIIATEKLRDTLLPELLSGRRQVSEAIN